MKKEVKDKKQIDIFDSKPEEKLFELIDKDEIQFPIFFKNKSETIYSCYFDYEKFEEITIRRYHEPFLFCILCGYNEMMQQLKGDVKVFLYTLYKNKIEIQAEEYEEVFQKALEERQKFFTTTEYKYVSRELSESQKNVKHRWKPIEL